MGPALRYRVIGMALAVALAGCNDGDPEPSPSPSPAVSESPTAGAPQLSDYEVALNECRQRVGSQLPQALDAAESYAADGEGSHDEVRSQLVLATGGVGSCLENMRQVDDDAASELVIRLERLQTASRELLHAVEQDSDELQPLIEAVRGQLATWPPESSIVTPRGRGD